MPGEPRVVIIGAGPAGLGAAWRLRELGHSDWALYEASGHPGGLAASEVDDHGFTWDLGGHVLFSHYPYFDALVNGALGDAWVEHIREAWVWMRGRWIPYPLQNNIWRLPPDDVVRCLDGLLSIHARRAGPSPKSFRDLLLAGFGEGLCETFMFPYNRKVWAYDPAKLDVGWTRERVAPVDLPQVLSNLVHRRDDKGWGPNSTFRFPLYGGTGGIWRAVCDLLPSERVNFECPVVEVDPSDQIVSLADGRRVSYDVLVSTMPLDLLLRMLRGRPDLARRAAEFVHSSSHIIGIGLAGQPAETLRTKCWMYFPEDNVPFYRATVFSNYSPHNVGRPGLEWSLMAEVSESPDKPVERSTVVAQVEEGLRMSGFIDGARVLSRWHRRIEHGYPTPWLGRDAVLKAIDLELRSLGIFSRGRFGGWKYEVSNQDHSLMQGVEAIDHILTGADERTYRGHMTG